MEKGSRDESASPLDGLLADGPQEEPPADLKERCLRALRGAEEEGTPEKARSSWRAALATAVALTATGFVLVIGILTLLSRVDGNRPMRHEAHMAELEDALAEVDRRADRAATEAGSLETTDAVAMAVAEAEDSLSPQRADAELRVEDDVRGQVVARTSGRPSPSLEFVDGRSRKVAEDYTSGDRVELAKRWTGTGSPYEPVQMGIGTADKDRWTGGAGALAKPWRDTSEERQKITRKEMEIEVKDVEDAHGRATSIIEGAGGYVETEEVQLGQNDRNQAHLVARVPVANLNDVVGQLRKLGKVLSLVGESDDRTKEYAARGAAIRELGARECELVEKYEKEKNRYRKQQLYQQIMVVRERNRQQKQPLLELSDKTHLASLDLTMVETGGPGRFLSNVFGNAGTAALWLAVSAIFWVPALLVITLLWRQIGKRGT